MTIIGELLKIGIKSKEIVPMTIPDMQNAIAEHNLREGGIEFTEVTSSQEK